MAKEEQRYTAQCTVEVVVYAKTAQAALNKVQKKLDDIGMSGTIEDMTDENGEDVTDGTEPENDEEEE